MVVSRLGPTGTLIVSLRGLRAAMQYDNQGGSFPGGRRDVELGLQVSGIGSEVHKGFQAAATLGAT